MVQEDFLRPFRYHFGWSRKVFLDHTVNIYIVFNGLEKPLKTIRTACLMYELMRNRSVFQNPRRCKHTIRLTKATVETWRSSKSWVKPFKSKRCSSPMYGGWGVERHGLRWMSRRTLQRRHRQQRNVRGVPAEWDGAGGRVRQVR